MTRLLERPSPLDHPGRADGEPIRSTLIAQPVAASSSMGYLAAAAWVMRQHARSESRPFARTCAVALAANAFGGVGFHGPGDQLSKTVHDVAVATTAVALPAHWAACLTRGYRPSPPACRVAIAALLAGAAAHRLGRPGSRLHRAPLRSAGHACWHLLSAVAIAGAATAFAPSPHPPS